MNNFLTGYGFDVGEVVRSIEEIRNFLSLGLVRRRVEEGVVVGEELVKDFLSVGRGVKDNWVAKLVRNGYREVGCSFPCEGMVDFPVVF